MPRLRRHDNRTDTTAREIVRSSERDVTSEQHLYQPQIRLCPMATSTAEHIASRSGIRSRPGASVLTGPAAASPGSPRTPVLGRSISGQYGSPGSYRVEHDDSIIYELGARHFSAGFASESRPRCILSFNPESGRRVGDFRAYEVGYQRRPRKASKVEQWGEEHALYRMDLRTVDLGLVADKLERALRVAHAEYLQLDQKPRKAILAVQSLLPTPLLEVVLQALFDHSAQPPSIMLMTNPVLACVSAGVRDALVVDVGWEETVVTAVGEYKEVCQRRSIRAGKRVTRDYAKVLGQAVRKHEESRVTGDRLEVSLEYAEEVMQRGGWCRPRRKGSSDTYEASTITLPAPASETQSTIDIPFNNLSGPTETALFDPADDDDDDSIPIHFLAHQVLLAVPMDLRVLCISRIILTGGISHIPGLKSRLLRELAYSVEMRGWDPVLHYGSATAHRRRVLQERSGNIAKQKQRTSAVDDIALSAAKKPLQESIPHAERIHDDRYDAVTQKAERESTKGNVEAVKGIIRGVETLGPWAGASLVASLKIKGVHDVEREDFLKHGLRDDGPVI